MLAAIAAAACNERYWVCDATDEERVSTLPRRLSETGLYANAQSLELADGVLAYHPQFPLYSDGSEKRRWIRLPAGSRIDTRDMNDWIFPEGTRVWKEFARDGKRVETRLLEKFGPGEDDWIGLAYVWDQSQRDAVAAPSGAIDVGGTSLDVPASGECMACHRGRKSRVLGFSAIQLSTEANPGEVNLMDLASAGRLTHPPAAPFRVPGNETEQAALGYLHANCSHCHARGGVLRDGQRHATRWVFALSTPSERSFACAMSSRAQTVSRRAIVVVFSGEPSGSSRCEIKPITSPSRPSSTGPPTSPLQSGTSMMTAWDTRLRTVPRRSFISGLLSAQ